MIAIQNKNRVLIWIIVILVATNLSMGISFLYHKHQDKMMAENTEEQDIDVPTEQRTRFFRDQLNLQPHQVDNFRELNRNFNRVAWQINHRLENLRIEMVYEMGKESPDRRKLEAISNEIGEQHTKLKNVTIDYYLSMKKVCTEQQKERLNEIFISVLKRNEDIRLPRRGRRLKYR